MQAESESVRRAIGASRCIATASAIGRMEPGAVVQPGSVQGVRRGPSTRPVGGPQRPCQAHYASETTWTSSTAAEGPSSPSEASQGSGGQVVGSDHHVCEVWCSFHPSIEPSAVLHRARNGEARKEVPQNQAPHLCSVWCCISAQDNRDGRRRSLAQAMCGLSTEVRGG